MICVIYNSSKGKCLNHEERLKIEALSQTGLTEAGIGDRLGGRYERTIKRELERREVDMLNSDLTARTVYSTVFGHQKQDYNTTAKGLGLKIADGYELVDFIEKEIIDEKKFPHVAAEEIKKA